MVKRHCLPLTRLPRITGGAPAVNHKATAIWLALRILAGNEHCITCAMETRFLNIYSTFFMATYQWMHPKYGCILKYLFCIHAKFYRHISPSYYKPDVQSLSLSGDVHIGYCHSLIFKDFTNFKWFQLSQYWLYRYNSFYTLVWKTDVFCRGNVRPSVRPSVRPRFPDFSSTGFEIPIWNLVYTFSRWHNMSSLSCITIGSLWHSLQPKVGQTYFCNHGLINQDKFFKLGTHVACCTTRDISPVFCKKYYFRNFGDYFSAFWIFRSFPAFFLHVLR